ncbi:MAG: BamA/TamA family outer membrane protein [Bacteroidetes bacterium]|nr:BamA/TamA family outer membrane protein [Bacteroidota bacterium]
MIFRQQVTVSFFKPTVVLTMLGIGFLFSCVAPKINQYPKNKAFVFKTTIKVDGNIPNNEKQDIVTRLTGQLDDSLRARTVTALRIKPPFVYQKLPNPPVLDRANISRSVSFMTAALNSIGYYNPVIKDTLIVDTVKDQYRAFIHFRVSPGKNLKLDSIGYDLQTPELQRLAMQSKEKSLLKKGAPFSRQAVSSELDRLIKLFQNNGYRKFSLRDIYAERDTVLAALIDPSLDPFQQAQLLENLRLKRENPTINIVIRQRTPKDSSELQKYFIDSVIVYPDLPLFDDSTAFTQNDTISKNKTTIISRSNKFKTEVIERNIEIHPGSLYKQNDYSRTQYRFGNQLGAWERATIDYEDSQKGDSLLNAVVRLYPRLKYTNSRTLEASYNTNDILTSTNLFGIGANISLRNRNTFKRSIQSNTTLRSGFEFGADFIQTQQAGISHSYTFPQTPSFLWFPKADTRNTTLNFNASYTDRRNFFTVGSIESSLGWDWQVGRKSYSFRPLNIEYNNLTVVGDSLNRLLDSVPSLKLAFKTGLVISRQFNYNSYKQYGKHTDFLRASAEESGTFLGLIKSINNGALARFIKGDIEFRHHIDYKRSELAFRAYLGAGLKYGAGKGTDQTLPIYKAFFAGGPNSMRGWQVRQLGLGSSVFYDTGIYTRADRFGDFKLETNLEYRFPLGNIYGIKIKSAVFADFGNIWNWRIPSDNPDSVKVLLKNSDFSINRFYNEFAVDIGTGLRFDFDYFIIRFDWAYKIRDPQRLQYPDRWFYDMQLKSGQLQLGIGYPF